MINVYESKKEDESNDNGRKKNELLRRKRMIVFSLRFDSLASMRSFFICLCGDGHLLEQVSLFIEICVQFCHTHFTFNKNDISQNFSCVWMHEHSYCLNCFFSLSRWMRAHGLRWLMHFIAWLTDWHCVCVCGTAFLQLNHKMLVQTDAWNFDFPEDFFSSCLTIEMEMKMKYLIEFEAEQSENTIHFINTWNH